MSRYRSVVLYSVSYVCFCIQFGAASWCSVPALSEQSVRGRACTPWLVGILWCSRVLTRGRVGVRGGLMEHLSPAGGARDVAGSVNNAGTEALSMEQDNNSMHNYADIESQAGSAAAVESSPSHFTPTPILCFQRMAPSPPANCSPVEC